jgi:hypothetical protein
LRPSRALSVRSNPGFYTECANAQCRNRGLLRFLVCGLEKAKAVGLWHALAHNMVCTGRLLAT